MSIGSPHPALGAEAQLLLLTSAMAPPAERLEKLLDGPLDWGHLIWLASRQRALPQLWRTLHALGPDRVPERVRTEVQPLVMVADFTMSVLRERLEDAVCALETAGIRAMLLKGAGLGLAYYPSFEERPMGDIDLLVDPDATDRAIEVLHGLGWENEFDQEFDRFYDEHHHLAPLRFGGTQVRLELHTDLFAPGHPFYLPISDIRGRAHQVALRHTTAWVAEPADAMIHLCTHFLWSHGASSGAWRTFRDVDVLLRSGEIRWDELVERANAARARTCVYWTLRLACNVGGIAVAASDVDRFRPVGSDFVLDRLEHHLATILLPSPRSCPSTTVARLMWAAVVQPRRSGHGSARPWSRSEVVRETFLDQQEESALARVAAQAGRLRAWGRYLSALLRSPMPRASA
jgi:hypothetical protein